MPGGLGELDRQSGPGARRVPVRHAAVADQESPIGDAWKAKLLTLKEGDVFLNWFSPTGFYSSAVNNGFIQELRDRSERQVAYTTETVGEHVAEYGVGPRKRPCI